MNTVYGVAFRGDAFLMVFNPKRNGWEMPGGKIEPGESIEEAARREFTEESGYDVAVISTLDAGDCYVCACRLLDKTGKGEMASDIFHELPDCLAFGRDEYDGVIDWARSALDAWQQCIR